jgi:TPR repeat protein
MPSLPRGILAELVVVLLCSVAPLGAAEQVAGAPQPAAEASLDFLPDQNDPVALKCDALADHPKDPHRVGDGVVFEQISVADALPVCEQAANQLPARPRYQYLYARVLEAAQRYDEAARGFTLADQAGYGLAAYSLGNFYADGTGVTEDHDKAAGFYFRAGNAGFADAYAELGSLYTEGASPNYPEALSWFDRAVQGGSNAGRVYLGELYGTGHGVQKDFAKAVALFAEAAQGGDLDGMFDLGLMYRDGFGVQQDTATAINWFYRAARMGHAMAAVEVGNSYYTGRGSGEDHVAAFNWYLRAADAQIPIAQRYVGYMYERGDGVTGSGPDAVTWYRRAAMQGDAAAMMLLGRHLRLMTSDEDKATGIRWLQRASERGSVDAQVDLALAYENGEDGLPQDDQQAAQWLGEAAKQGDAFAQVQLGELYQRGSGVDRDLDQARRLYMQAAASTDPKVAELARASLAALNPAPRPAPSPAPQPSDADAADDASPPVRRLPTQASTSASERSDATAKIAIGVGLAIGTIWVLNHFMGSDSQDSTESSPAPYVPYSPGVISSSPTSSTPTPPSQPYRSFYTDPARMNKIPMGNLGDPSISSTGNRWAR